MLRRALLACSLPALLSMGACRTNAVAPSDGGPDAFAGDGPLPDVVGALALDFAVTGCKRFDTSTAVCTGGPPLTVTFSPVGSAALTRYLWSFGDGTPSSSERAPTHTYVLPGTYDVGLVAGGVGGTASRTRTGFIDVTRVGVGAPCDIDGQCDTGLTCLCGASAPCGPTFPHGLCTRACPAAGCGGTAACATLDVPPPGDGGAPTSVDGGAATDAGDAPDAPDAPAMVDSRDAPAVFDALAADAPVDAPAAFDAPTADARAPLDAGATPITRTPVCLATCKLDGDCASGLVCRALRTTGASATLWARACVPVLYRDLGATCRDATGQLDDEVCASGTCADLGALGMCSATCVAGAACPPGSACATLGDGRALCLRACAVDFSCTVDPLLDCEVEGHGGPLGFKLSPSMPSVTFCAPRACTASTDCGPAGTCTPLGVGGHCASP